MNKINSLSIIFPVYKDSKTVESLINKSISEWSNMYIKLQPILIHNQNLLKELAGSRQKIEIEYKLINLLSNEPIQNYQKLL